MLTFYRRLYPFKSIYNWLNHEHSPSRLFTHREFAFTLPGDVYLRYNSFTTAEELKNQVCQLNPTRFEIGPVYSARVGCCFAYWDSVSYSMHNSLEIKRQYAQARSIP
jgi:DNA primase small subunit